MQRAKVTIFNTKTVRATYLCFVISLSTKASGNGFTRLFGGVILTALKTLRWRSFLLSNGFIATRCIAASYVSKLPRVLPSTGVKSKNKQERQEQTAVKARKTNRRSLFSLSAAYQYAFVKRRHKLPINTGTLIFDICSSLFSRASKMRSI